MSVDSKNPCGIVVEAHWDRNCDLVFTMNESHEHEIECSEVNQTSQLSLEDGSVTGTREFCVDHFVEEDDTSHLTEVEESDVDGDLYGDSVYDMCQPRSILTVVEGEQHIRDLGIEVSLIEAVEPTT
jgi:hypothetical protein